jgi:hypothetical protein
MGRLFKAHEVNIAQQTVTIPISERARVVVIDRGQVKEYDVPEHGITSIVTQDGKVLRLKYEEAEKF